MDPRRQPSWLLAGCTVYAAGSMLTVAVYGDYVIDRVHRLKSPFRWHTANTVDTGLLPGGAPVHITSCLARLNVTARALGRIGDDPEGRQLSAALADRGVDISHLQIRGRTGVVTIIVEPDGERTFLIDTNQDARTESLTDALTTAALAGVDAIHVSGHTLIRDTDPTRAGERIAQLSTSGILAAIELPDPPTLAAYGIDNFRRVLDCAGFDLIIGNTTEAAALGIGASWIPPQATCVVTAGGGPITVTAQGGPVIIPVAPADNVVDTTGAGDVFAAAFLLAWLTDREPEAAVARAHHEACRFISSGRPESH